MAPARRMLPADLALLLVVIAWALNFSVAKYVLAHGFQPIVYSAIRYLGAAAVLCTVTLRREGSLRMERRDLVLLLGAGLVGVWVNQIAFVYAIRLSGVTTTALIMGTLPIMTALAASALGIEAFSRRFAIAGVVSFGGVALVVAGSGGSVGGSIVGELLALAAAAAWAIYTVVLKPLSGRYSPYRIFSIVLLEGAVLLPLTGVVQFSHQSWSLGVGPWAAIVFSTVVPLVLANLLWISSIGRVGPSRAALFTNLQPVFATAFALLLLSEAIAWAQIAGGALIGAALLVARRRARAAGGPRNGASGRTVRGMVRRRANR